jgi:hypothetical protein
MEFMKDGYGAVNADRVRVGKLTPASLRDLALSKRLISGPGVIAEHLPTPDELETAASMMYEAVVAGKMFDFGHWSNEFIKKVSIRGGSLYNQKALGHPFSTPWVFYHTWDDAEVNKRWGEDHINYTAYLVNPLPKTDSTLGCDVEITAIDAFDIADNKGNYVKFLGVGDRALLMPEHELPEGAKYACQVAPVFLRFPVRFWTNFLTEIGQKADFHSSMLAAASNVLDPMCVALLLLNTRGVPIKTISVDDKLNKARVKNRKPIIPPYRKVDSAYYTTAMLRQTTGQKEAQGGTHASPVPHIRQGHWRNYTSGERTFIRDTLVNATPEMREYFKTSRSMYKVKGTME